MGNTICSNGRPVDHYKKTDDEERELNSERLDSDIDEPIIKNSKGEVIVYEGYRPRGACVFLNVYDLFISNLSTEKYGIGVFHTGVEVYGQEFSFVGGPDDMCSIVCTRPRDTSWMQNGRYKESLYVGRTQMTRKEVQLLRFDLAKKRPCSSYDILLNNCNHFSELFTRALTLNQDYELPKKITRIVHMGQRVRCCLPRALLDPLPPQGANGTSSGKKKAKVKWPPE
eukprot:TRINITY_DN3389_c0_g3_i1.p1 TRINITY_DN3389_c0_g3~~TRINITY_DN3389_c0_g3_i1.p1  ORF type:complete len:227 (-),score=48.54 TRINITY_DN3389_c0_g3_i1:237-917(-)